MIESLRRLGIAIDSTESRVTGGRGSRRAEPRPSGSGAATYGKMFRIAGSGGKIPASEADLYIANSGTSVRFLTALAALGHGRFRLEGTQRMHQRPIADLLEGLADLGVQLNSENGNGCPPVVVHGAGISGGKAKIRGDVSSQFLERPAASGSLCTKTGGIDRRRRTGFATVCADDARRHARFGIDVPEGNLQRFNIPQAQYQGRAYSIEPDASAASYFFAAAAITGGEVTVEGLSRKSLQGDIAFCEALEKAGCKVAYAANSITVSGPPTGKKLCGIGVNMNAISDTVQTMAAVALFADGPTTMTGVGHIRHKETDRIGNLAIELRKFDATVEELSDGLKITPPKELHSARIATYNDHRMAMSLALVGLRVPGVLIEDPKCTEKTYPGYFDDLAKLVG